MNEPQPQRDSILLLIVDPSLCARTIKILQAQEYHVFSTGSLKDALHHFKRQPSDLVITDLAPDHPDSLELISQLRQQRSRVRFIRFRENSAMPTLRETTHQGIVAHLNPHCDGEDLLFHVERAIAMSHGRPNRREHNRYLFTVSTHCILVNPFNNTEGRPHPCLIREISRSGLSAIVREMIPVPAILKLVVHLPGSSQPITLVAKSVSCMMTQMSGVYRLGVKFVSLLPSEIEESLSKMGQHLENQPNPNDIFMGKSFKDALSEWLLNHKQVLNMPLVDESQYPYLAEQICRGAEDGESKFRKTGNGHDQTNLLGQRKAIESWISENIG